MQFKDFIRQINSAKKWIVNNTVDGAGIPVFINEKKKSSIYPEVTGYFIPTLLKYGMTELAVTYGHYLLSIQNEDGSWNESTGVTPYTFDTCMILKGLIALISSSLDPENKFLLASVRAANWVLTMQRNDGSVGTPDTSDWTLSYGKKVPEAIHVYCLSPFYDLAKITNNSKFSTFADRALSYYLSCPELTDFNTLSHFNAYIIEGLIDVGEIDRAKRAMDLISLHQRIDGSIPAYSFVDFVCSTGLFQYSICWFKLGEFEKGQKAFEFATSLQNSSGGWYGSYSVGKDRANYFPDSEISWAVKFFLDAVYFGNGYMRAKKAVANEKSLFLDLSKQPESPADLALRYVKNTISYLKKYGVNRISLYGAGEVCKVLLPVLESNSIAIERIFDRNAKDVQLSFPQNEVIPFSCEIIHDGDVILITSLGSKYSIEKYIKKTVTNKNITILKLESPKESKLYIYDNVKKEVDTKLSNCRNSLLDFLSISVCGHPSLRELFSASLFVLSFLRWGMKNEAYILGKYISSCQNDDGSWNGDEIDCYSSVNTSVCASAIAELFFSEIDRKNEFKRAFDKAVSFIDSNFNSFFNSDEDVRLSNLCNTSSVINDGSFIFDVSESTFVSIAFLNDLFRNKCEKLDSKCNPQILSLCNDFTNKIENCLLGVLFAGQKIRFTCPIPLLAYLSLKCNKPELTSLFLQFYDESESIKISSLELFLTAISQYKLGMISEGEQSYNKLLSLIKDSKLWSVFYAPESSNKLSIFFAFYSELLTSRSYAIYDHSCEAIADIAPNDGRYSYLKDRLLAYCNEQKLIRGNDVKIDFLDLGCGKLRYTKKLIKELSEYGIHYYGVDITQKIMSDAPDSIEKKEGTILDIPYATNKFDFIFLSESLEHCIDLNLAIMEIHRVLKDKGCLLIIDKDLSSEARDAMTDHEQWFGQEDFSHFLLERGFSEVDTKIDLTDGQTIGFNFTAWLAKK